MRPIEDIREAGAGWVNETELAWLCDKHVQLRAALQEFVTRCDNGEIRSTYTYEKFKRLLAET